MTRLDNVNSADSGLFAPTVIDSMSRSTGTYVYVCTQFRNNMHVCIYVYTHEVYVKYISTLMYMLVCIFS